MPALNISPDIAYLKTPQAILKIVQIVTLLIAFSCITDCCDGGKPYALSFLYTNFGRGQGTVLDYSDHIRNTSFFLAVTIFGWLLVVFLFVFFFFKLHERFKQIKWEMVVMIISIVWSVLLLLSCSLMGNISSTVFPLRPTESSSDDGDTPGGVNFLKKYVDTLVAGVVFGFFATIAFIVDAALHFWQFWSKRRSGNNGSTDNPAVTKVAENPGPSTMQNQTQQQVPPVQTLGAPPRYDALTNLPGQIPNTAGQMPNTAGQMPNTAGQMPNTAGQTALNPAGQTVVMYPPGQQYQAASGQPAQMWQVA
ncbi:uncharacterized protein LOC116304005 [Actinia tenebrosa]|uniref:Uncharacterized protein LOC116304005 n=1 Tax=Actinia tenebrosa TaxID=6105 RepID=A0A6P8ITC1_ACTTE|nr:uncharacterized protein LOC116304005 [Actinia tenebrosa]